MTTTQESGPPEYVLTLERLIDAPVGQVWRRWTESGLLEAWFCPKPWYVTDARIDLRPAGEFSSVMHGPNGEEVENVGVFLEIEPERRLVTTDAFHRGWISTGRAVMVAEILLEPAGEGSTRYTARARHWDEAARHEHEALGFHEGVAEGRRSAGDPRQVDLAQKPGRFTMEKTSKVRTCLWLDD